MEFFPDCMRSSKRSCAEMALNEGEKHGGWFKILSCLIALDCFDTPMWPPEILYISLEGRLHGNRAFNYIGLKYLSYLFSPYVAHNSSRPQSAPNGQ